MVLRVTARFAQRFGTTQGATSEGDVKQKQHVEKTPLTQFWESWDGTSNLDRSFGALDVALQARR